jgi:hypothetical protein
MTIVSHFGAFQNACVGASLGHPKKFSFIGSALAKPKGFLPIPSMN